MQNNKNEKKNPVALEEEKILEFWEKSKIFEKSVDKVAPHGSFDSAQDREYVFYDGPPFATGLPHYGHIVASIIKDSVPRFWTMKGFRVERKWGWDCHGLPIENIVEKEMGSKSKKDIEKLGVAKFNQSCRAQVMTFADDWKKYIRKLGRWVDMENDYKTMDKPFMESVWWVFKTLWDKGLVYKDYRSMHICPRCETTLSQSEVTEGYKDVKDLSAIVKFRIMNHESGIMNQELGIREDDEVYVLAWTTTPWTLIGNVALAVGEDIEYVIIEESATAEINPSHEHGKYALPSNDKYIIAKELFVKDDQKLVPGNELSQVYIYNGKNYRVIGIIKGKDLAGYRYKPLFGYYSADEKLENRENGWKIYAGDFVTTEEGTGVVHIAPAFGDDDMKLGKKYNLPFVQHVDMDGHFRPEVKDFAGFNVKPIGDHMATDIEIIKYLAHHGLLFHKEKYEHSYPHCWRCDTPLLNYATSSWFINVTKIKDKLLDNAKRINWSPEHIKEGRWGNWLEGARDWSISRQRFWASVIPIWECACGERKVIGSVEELETLSAQKVEDLHKHVVDEITFKCEKCSGTMKRIPDVFDCWFESGAMPFAQLHYPFENKEKFEKNFPAQFIAEGADQCRAWFYYLHILGEGAKGSEAFRNVIVNGIVLAEDGKKMSKKLKNYPDPMEVFNQYGADALRYYLLTSPVMLADTLCFSEKGVREAYQKVNMILSNVVKFYQMFASGETSLLRSDSGQAFPSPSKGEGTDLPCSENVLDQWILARLEELIVAVTAGMEKYNLPQASRPIVGFIDDLSTWYIRRSRDRFKSGDRNDRESALATTRFVLIELSKVMAPFTPFIAEKVWQEVTGYDFKYENKSVHLEAWPTSHSTERATNSDILKNMEITRKIVELALAKRDEAGVKIRQPLAQLRIENCELRGKYLDLIQDEVNVKNVEFEKGDGGLSVELDLEITEELKLEGMKRELVRTINGMRKDQGLTIKDVIDIKWKSEKIIAEVFAQHGEELKKETLAATISQAEIEGKEIDINGEKVVLAIEKK